MVHKIKPEIKKRWTDALRDPKYKQATGALERRNKDGTVAGRCCLGVACHIFKDELKLKMKVLDGKASYDDSISFMPPKLCEFLGFDTRSDNGELKTRVKGRDGQECYSLAGLNDSGATFQEIADVIDEQF